MAGAAASIDVAAQPALGAQGKHGRRAQYLRERLLHTLGHALQAAADRDEGAFIDPAAQPPGAFAQAVLHIALSLARIHEV